MNKTRCKRYIVCEQQSKRARQAQAVEPSEPKYRSCATTGASRKKKTNQQKRNMADVLADMTAKVLENASQLARVVRSQARALTAQGVFNAPGEGGTDLALEFALATSEEDAGNSTRVIDLTSGPRAKRQRLLLERGLFGRDSALDPGAAVPTNADSWGRRAHAR